MIFRDDDVTVGADATLVARTLYGPAVDMILAQENVDVAIGQPDRVLWSLSDHLGSVTTVVDSDSQVVDSITYDSFGQIVAETNAAVDFLFGYTGRELDRESDLYYYRARYYDPGVGRFVSRDPIGFAGGDANLYRYVGNEPTGKTDPSGLDPALSPMGPGSHIYDPGYGERRPTDPRPWYERQWWNPAALNAQLAVWWTEAFSLDLEKQRQLNVAKQWMAANATAYPNYNCGYDYRDGGSLGETGHDAMFRIIQMPLKAAETGVAVADTMVIVYGGATITRGTAAALVPANRGLGTLVSRWSLLRNNGWIQMTFPGTEGDVILTGRACAEGSTLHIRYAGIKEEGGSVFEALRYVKKRARDAGFEKLRISGMRQTGANRGPFDREWPL